MFGGSPRPFEGLGSPVVPFCPFYLGVSVLKPNIWKEGTLIVKGLLGNLEDLGGHFRVLPGFEGLLRAGILSSGCVIGVPG